MFRHKCYLLLATCLPACLSVCMCVLSRNFDGILQSSPLPSYFTKTYIALYVYLFYIFCIFNKKILSYSLLSAFILGYVCVVQSFM